MGLVKLKPPSVSKALVERMDHCEMGNDRFVVVKTKNVPFGGPFVPLRTKLFPLS